MSEYQYYEFQAIDRPLTNEEQKELRSYSTRARITPTKFVNEYSWGGLKGNKDVWLDKSFDAYLYLANWGTHMIELRLPTRLLDARTAQSYCVGEHASVRESNGNVILSFTSDNEGGGEWIEGDGYLSALIPIRAELSRGDLRALYLGWLLEVQNGDLTDDTLEPQVPAGLGQLSTSLEGFVQFLRLDPNLVYAAATASPMFAHDKPSLTAIRTWLAKLPPNEKDDYLAQVVAGDEAVASKLIQRMRKENDANKDVMGPSPKRRTVAELFQEAKRATTDQKRIAEERDAQRKREVAAARIEYLDKLVEKERTLWKQVEDLIAVKRPDRYDQAVVLLADLRDLSARGDGFDFRRRLEGLRTEHVRKISFIDRLRKAGL